MRFTLLLSVVLILSTFVAYYIHNEFQSASATVINSKDQLMPFDMKKMMGTEQSQNETSKNSSNVVPEDNPITTTDCEMPPCPPGHACIQSCP
jgi:hypothetical protein